MRLSHFFVLLALAAASSAAPALARPASAYETTRLGLRLDAPVTTLSLTTNSADVFWSAVSGAYAYRVYITLTNAAGSYSYYTDTFQLYYDNASGAFYESPCKSGNYVNYTIQVAALDSSLQPGPSSSIITYCKIDES